MSTSTPSKATAKAGSAKPAVKAARTTNAKVTPARKVSVKQPPSPATPRTTVKKAAAPASASVQPQSSTKADKKVKAEKVKLVRDSFTIPKTEYIQLADLKKRAMALGTEVKKSELIRAGLALLSGSTDASFKAALAKIPTLKTGRPGKA